MKRPALIGVLLLALSVPALAAPGRDTDNPRRDREWRLPRQVMHVVKRVVQPLSDILLPPRP